MISMSCQCLGTCCQLHWLSHHVIISTWLLFDKMIVFINFLTVCEDAKAIPILKHYVDIRM